MSDCSCDIDHLDLACTNPAHIGEPVMVDLREVLGEHADNPRAQEWVREFRVWMDQAGFWDRLGVDEGGMPIHLPIAFTADGQGPATVGMDAAYLGCWCPDPNCPLARSLREASDLGVEEA